MKSGRKNVIGILAHVDAGKTTCIENMLYLSGRIRRMGRVDHRDTVLDYDAQERDRRLMQAMLEVRRKYGPNVVFKALNLLDGATTLERNQQIGGHRA